MKRSRFSLFNVGQSAVKVVLQIFCVLLIGLFHIPGQTANDVSPATAAAQTQNDSSEREKWEIKKLRQEAINLKQQNENNQSLWSKLSDFAPFLMAVIALLGFLATMWKQNADSNRQRQLDRKQRDLDREQRETESQRRVDEKFNTAVGQLGSKSEAIQASAVVSLVTYLKPEYVSLHEQVFAILLPNLRIEHSETVSQLIVQAFEKALRVELKRASKSGEKLELDLSRTNLIRADLSGLDLTEADLGFAQLRLANLSGCKLFRVRGIQANFEKARLSRADLGEARIQRVVMRGAYVHECKLVAADLKGANLRDARFFRSKMQSAHFEGADIRGAEFEEADINDAYFTDAITDERTLRSLTNAYHWQKAHFDEGVRTRLLEFAGE